MRVTSGMIVEQFQRNLSRNTENLARLQDQLSSGKRIRRPSDDPKALAQALKLRTNSDKNEQYLRNMNSARGWLGAADSALDQLSTLLIKARDIALRAGTGTNGPDERKQFGAQVSSLLGEALQSVNTTHEGNYLFAGTLLTGYDPGTGVLAPPFELDPAAGGIYHGNGVRMPREIGPGILIDVNIPGDATVEGTAVFATTLTALSDLKTHLEGNDVGAVEADLQGVTDSIDRVLALRGLVGSTANRLDATEKVLKTDQVNVKVLLSRAEDTDVAEVMAELMTQEGVYKATLAVGGRVLQPSLLDFLR